MFRRILPPGLAWLACLFVLAPASAFAAPAVIGFDDLPPGTAIATQYASQGVRFGERPASGPAGGAFGATASATARSAPNVATLAFDAFNDFSSSWIKFDKQQSEVVLHACRTGLPGGPARPNVNVLAYDSNGTEIVNLQGIECDLNGALVPVTVTSAHITYLNVYGVGSGWAIDDLRFEVDPAPQPPPPDPPPPPLPPPPKDFSFTFADAPASETIAIRPGETTRRTLLIDRNESSFGPIRVYVTKAPPPGVHIAFTPSIPSSSSDDAVTMQIVVDAGTSPAYFNKLQILAEPQGSTAGPVSHSLQFNLVVQGRLAARTEGIEITQAVQIASQPLFEEYKGVALVRGKKTVVRVFADLVGTLPIDVAATVTRPPLGMALYGVDGQGRSLPGSPLSPDWSPPTQAMKVNDYGLSNLERMSSGTAFTFVLPDSWTQGRLSLTSKTLAPDPAVTAGKPRSATLCASFNCGAVQLRGLNAIEFRPAPNPKVLSALKLLYRPNAIYNARPVTAARTFEKLLALSPVPFVFLDGADRTTPWPQWRATRVAPPGQILETAQNYDEQSGKKGDYVMGVFAWLPGAGYAPGPRTGVTDASDDGTGLPIRPTTLVAHETLHLLGLGHADTACGGGGGDFPDPTGRMRSVGLDTTAGSGGAGAEDPLYRAIPDLEAVNGFDLMSYCNIVEGDLPHWISARNWQRLLEVEPVEGTYLRQPRPGVTGPALTVRGRVDGAMPSIVSVHPVDDPGASPGDPSPYTLVARDAAGGVVASSAVTQNVVHSAAGALDYTQLQGSVPRGRVARVQVVQGQTVVAERVAGAHTPTIAVSAPRSGAHVRTRRSLTVRWKAADADPGDALDATVEVSTDGGASYRAVAGGPDRGFGDAPRRNAHGVPAGACARPGRRWLLGRREQARPARCRARGTTRDDHRARGPAADRRRRRRLPPGRGDRRPWAPHPRLPPALERGRPRARPRGIGQRRPGARHPLRPPDRD